MQDGVGECALYSSRFWLLGFWWDNDGPTFGLLRHLTPRKPSTAIEEKISSHSALKKITGGPVQRTPFYSPYIPCTKLERIDQIDQNPTRVHNKGRHENLERHNSEHPTRKLTRRTAKLERAFRRAFSWHSQCPLCCRLPTKFRQGFVERTYNREKIAGLLGSA